MAASTTVRSVVVKIMQNITASVMRQSLRSLANSDIAQHSARFFKSGKGEYGEGDRFHGVRIPVVRSLVKKFHGAPQRAVTSLLKSIWHEERMLAVLILVDQFKCGTASGKKSIFDAYMQHRKYVNNWDLVDSSAHLIVGPQLESGRRVLLVELANSKSLWDRRIAMIATYHYIRQGDFSDALKIAKILRNDEHDLIHKAVGWMLREVGNRNRVIEEDFLKQYYKEMPRTMLRYSIEKFPETLRKAYLHGRV